MKSKLVAIVIAAGTLLTEFTASAADAQHGKDLYQSRCGSCHSLEYNGLGPAHKGVFGRKAGSAPGFAYSRALKDSTVIWNEQALERWLSGPEAFIPGQKMGFSVQDAAERAEIIAYLAAASKR